MKETAAAPAEAKGRDTAGRDTATSAPTEVDRATRARRRTRTRRRNGEVVAGETQGNAPARSAEA
jgi:hypothetical protein